jgi:hypothetical protein
VEHTLLLRNRHVMSKGRYALANTLILLILTASFYDIVRDEEHWPFSQYPMFNRVTSSRELKWLRLYGVTQEGKEFPLIRYADVFPFDQSRLSKGLGSIAVRPGAAAQLHAALANCLERHERQRQKGWHDGPALSGLRLYEVRWTLDPRAANVDTPDSRRLIAEVAR